MAKQILQDKKSIIHVLAGLMAKPELLKNTREYKITIADFPERFHKLVFGAINNLFEQGIEQITPVSIDGYLSNMPAQYLTFNDNGGLDYLYKMEEIGEPSNFDMYYNQVKKYSFLRSCAANGIDVSDLYDTTLVDIKETEKQQEVFDSITLEEMMNHIESKLVDIKDDFLSDKDNKGSHMSDNLKAIVQQKMEKPTYGAGLASGYYNAVTRAARLRKVYLVSGSSGSGKSRFALANMLAICVPEKWNSKTKQWEKTGARGRCLFVSTELEEDEIKIPALCYIADVSEYKLQNAKLDDEEKERLMKAIEVLEKTPFWFEELHDFDLADIEHVISKNVTKNGVQYIA
ncbi:DnaB-like helicase C-terminal domain-containing protein [Bacillus sp. FJAT-22090]|uniref:DnaB-like helicase C-terminal domain-containing protein n=1 Tax=Bacillus sp. FJAT-22090 TaxID=1581038 RepID=UPI0011A52E0E|nr:DnaB-like helicase C-terminal domain-containing protein [Bacillus sp. FJAT-22090]